MAQALRTSRFVSADERSFPRHATRFSTIDNGAFIKAYVCLIGTGSQNTSLTQLLLGANKIGEAGASGLGAGLACVLLVFGFCG